MVEQARLRHENACNGTTLALTDVSLLPLMSLGRTLTAIGSTLEAMAAKAGSARDLISGWVPSGWAAGGSEAGAATGSVTGGG